MSNEPQNPARSWRRYLPLISHPDKPKLVPVLRFSGVIGSTSSLRRGLALASLAGEIERAFSMRGAGAVALIINSPGGTPVQSGLIYKRIRDLAVEKSLPVLAFVEDVAASGGYMLALAADEIFVHEASIVGSIGVVSGGFGFVEALKKLGVERRLHSAGEHKAMLDPFSPEKPEDVARLKALQTDIHGYFTALVKARRGDKLRGPEDGLFSGDIWVGARAVEAGLADGIGDIRGVLRAKFGDDVKIRPVAAARWPRLPFTPNFANQRLADDMAAMLDERALWARFGL